ncbi:hypothetical protein [Agromyces sp. SYSU T00194]|uniref:hypothetical protein n=1 Tax=Agromyces chitinivorans TaxID=3158560 RepID=UPI0033920547
MLTSSWAVSSLTSMVMSSSPAKARSINSPAGSLILGTMMVVAMPITIAVAAATNVVFAHTSARRSRGESVSVDLRAGSSAIASASRLLR